MFYCLFVFTEKLPSACCIPSKRDPSDWRRFYPPPFGVWSTWQTAHDLLSSTGMRANTSGCKSHSGPTSEYCPVKMTGRVICLCQLLSKCLISTVWLGIFFLNIKKKCTAVRYSVFFQFFSLMCQPRVISHSDRLAGFLRKYVMISWHPSIFPLLLFSLALGANKSDFVPGSDWNTQ